MTLPPLNLCIIGLPDVGVSAAVWRVYCRLSGVARWLVGGVYRCESSLQCGLASYSLLCAYSRVINEERAERERPAKDEELVAPPTTTANLIPVPDSK